jgi:hypothetical protein
MRSLRAIEGAAAAEMAVLTVTQARQAFHLTEADFKKGVAAGAIKARRGARGARTVLRAHVEAWARRLHEDGGDAA